ncbi:MAG: hypothetical protein GTO24_01210 [candidate division Zixibacteria bacterium]|nr:hypothetical protein [candidate division Zixibacteria bacterium]
MSAGLSLDELGSIHERSRFLFSSWGLSGRMHGWIPLAVPALLILIFTLQRMRHFSHRRYFWLVLAAFATFGLVAFFEYIEALVKWPRWFKGMRFGMEEGTELVAIFLLLCVVHSPKDSSGKTKSIMDLIPRLETLTRLKPTIVVLTLVGFIPLGILTVGTLVVTENRGIPAMWLPFMLLNLACIGAWIRAKTEVTHRKHFQIAGLLALFFSLDQIIVFQRVVDMSLLRGTIENLMFPCMAAVCMSIPTLRTRSNITLLVALLALGIFLIPSSDLFPRLVIPLQSLGVFYLFVSPPVGISDVGPRR